MALLLMSMTSISSTNFEKHETVEEKTPDSWCQATYQQVVRD